MNGGRKSEDILNEALLLEKILAENNINSRRILYVMKESEFDRFVADYGEKEWKPANIAQEISRETSIYGIKVLVESDTKISPGDVKRVWHNEHWWRCKVRTSSDLDNHWYVMLIDDRGNNVKETIKKSCELKDFVKAGETG